VAECLTPILRRRTPVSPAELASALDSYARVQTAMLAAWQDLIAYLYDGRLAALMRSGRTWMAQGSGVVKAAAQHHIERHVGLQASGAATTSRYSRALLRLLARHGLRGIDPAALAIR
jgi:hypothetical protein